MMLRELAAVPTASLPIRDFADHLRLGTGFADDGSQDAVLETYLRSALAAIETRVSKAFFQRQFRWTLAAWSSSEGQVLPVAPVVALESVAIVSADETANTLDPTSYGLAEDAHRPRILPVGRKLPSVPAGGTAEIVFDAGFGPAWSDVPGDLRQAVMMLAAGYFESRGVSGDAGAMPFGIHALIEPYRDVRLGGAGK